METLLIKITRIIHKSLSVRKVTTRIKVQPQNQIQVAQVVPVVQAVAVAVVVVVAVAVLAVKAIRKVKNNNQRMIRVKLKVASRRKLQK